MPTRILALTPAERAAIRMRNYRHRQRQGLLVVRTVIRPEVVTGLIEEGRLPREKAEDLVAVGDALAEKVNDLTPVEPTTEDID